MGSGGGNAEIGCDGCLYLKCPQEELEGRTEMSNIHMIHTDGDRKKDIDTVVVRNCCFTSYRYTRESERDGGLESGDAAKRRRDGHRLSARAEMGGDGEKGGGRLGVVRWADGTKGPHPLSNQADLSHSRASVQRPNEGTRRGCVG